MKKKFWLAAVCGGLLFSQAGLASVALKPLMDHRFSVGALVGYGSTSWNMLSAYCKGDEECLDTMSASTPIGAEDKGLMWGVTLGYQIEENFAIRAIYRRFHSSIINFGAWSFYDKLPQETPCQISSSVYSYSLMGEFFAPMFGSPFFAFAELGPTVTHRKDLLTNRGHINLSFGMGFGRVLWKRFDARIAFFYSTGFDHSTTTPADSYTPFLLSLEFQLAYRF